MIESRLSHTCTAIHRLPTSNTHTHAHLSVSKINYMFIQHQNESNAHEYDGIFNVRPLTKIRVVKRCDTIKNALEKLLYYFVKLMAKSN